MRHKSGLLVGLGLWLLCTACSANVDNPPAQAIAANVDEPPAQVTEENKTFLYCHHIDSDEFYRSIENPNAYEAKGIIRSGVIPHHNVASPLISGFFKAVATHADEYDTVVIVSPNHAGDLGDIIVSKADWKTGDDSTVLCDTDIEDAVLRLDIPNAKIIEHNKRMEDDHSSSILVPYIHHYLPNARVAPVLVSRTLTLDATLAFAEHLSNILRDSGKKTLLVCSIDFSHYLKPAEAAKHDVETMAAMDTHAYDTIHRFGNTYMDSPASLIVFLKYAERLALKPNIIDHTDASVFLGETVPETTTYFVMTTEE